MSNILSNTELLETEYNKEVVIPIYWKGWDEGWMLSITLYNIIFHEDFWVFNRGDEFEVCEIDYQAGFINVVVDNESGENKIQYFKVTPTEAAI